MCCLSCLLELEKMEKLWGLVEKIWWTPYLAGGFKPFEKYQSVGTIIPNISKNKNVPNHQPDIGFSIVLVWFFVWFQFPRKPILGGENHEDLGYEENRLKLAMAGRWPLPGCRLDSLQLGKWNSTTSIRIIWMDQESQQPLGGTKQLEYAGVCQRSCPPSNVTCN